MVKRRLKDSTKFGKRPQRIQMHRTHYDEHRQTRRRASGAPQVHDRLLSAMCQKRVGRSRLEKTRSLTMSTTCNEPHHTPHHQTIIPGHRRSLPSTMRCRCNCEACRKKPEANYQLVNHHSPASIACRA